MASPDTLAGAALVRLDHERLAEILDLGDDVLAQLVQGISGDIQTFQRQLETGGIAGARLTIQAHSLKGACLTVGAQALGEMFAGCEQLAKTGDVAQILPRLDRNAALIEETLALLAAIAAQR